MVRVWFDGNDQNGPKRRRTRRSGHMYVFFFVFRVFSNLCFISYLGSIYFLNERESWFGLRRRKRAKTTRDTSFGP
jgi:hypothetical protein